MVKQVFIDVNTRMLLMQHLTNEHYMATKILVSSYFNLFVGRNKVRKKKFKNITFKNSKRKLLQVQDLFAVMFT